MKKIYLLMTACLIAMLMSCSKEERYVSKVEDLADDLVEAVEKGDEDEIKEIGEKLEKLQKDAPDMEDLDEDQKKRLEKATGKILGAAFGAAFSGMDLE